MKVTEGKQMEYISGHDIFKIVDSVDSSYRVMCQMETGDYKIRPDTLKAIRLPECEVRILCDAACYGVSSLQEAREALESEPPYGALQIIRKDLAEKSLPVFEKIYVEQ